MKRSRNFFILCAALFSSASFSVPLCQNTNNNIDPNGWGWENGSSCVVAGSVAASSVTVDAVITGTPACSAGVNDTDGDGWGYENGQSCLVGNIGSANSAPTVQLQSGASAVADIPACGIDVVDFDGDGWGYENGQSCLVGNAGSTSSASASQSAPVSPAFIGIPTCGNEVNDFDGDGWGYENGESCLVADGGSVNGLSQSVSSDSPVPVCSNSIVDSDGDGWGYENGESCLVGMAGSSEGVSQQTSGATPVGVRFIGSTLRRIGGTGDNWCQTWADDGSVITAMDDGDWFNGGRSHHSRLYRIHGAADNFSRSEVSEYPDFASNGDGWFAYGTLSVKGVLYSLVSKTQGENWSVGPFRGLKMLRSYDSGESWHRVDRFNNDRFLDRWDIGREELGLDEMFFFEEYGRWGKGKNAYPFSFASFVQNGQDNRASKDGYVYVYSPEGASSNHLMLARVPEGQIGNRSAWRYFKGWDGANASWSSDVEARQPVMVYPEKNSAGEYFGWYSWLPSVVWNPGLQKYIMVNGGTYAGRGLSDASHDYYNAFVHEKTGSLGLWASDTPFGPWSEIFYTDYWTVDSAENRTYQPKLSPKWISEDGRTMTLVWSDGMLGSDGRTKVNYMWNQMEIEIQTR